MTNHPLLAKIEQHLPVTAELLAALSKGSLTAWLVGGCIRDLILDRQYTDIDVVSVEDPSDWARCWARGRGHWFWLDKQRRHSRIVLPQGICLDFSPLRAATIEGDLVARDFTINALAVDLNEAGSLIDPLNGVSDLHDGCLKACSTSAFSDDPLRMLKGVRHAAVLNFRFDESSLKAMAINAPLIQTVAPERVRDELLQIFSTRELAYSLDVLFQAGILNELFGSPVLTWSPAGHGQSHQVIFDRIGAAHHQQGLPPIGQLLKQRSLFLFAAFLAAYAPDRYLTSCKKLPLSREQRRILLALQDEISVEWIKGLNHLSRDRQRALAVEQLNPSGLQRVFYWGWCQEKIPEAQRVALLTAYWKLENNGRIPHLLDGDLMAGYVDRRQIGAWQQKIKMAELNGLIHCSEDARNWMKSQLSIDKN